LCVVLSAGAGAQRADQVPKEPDFSGRWVLTQPRDAPANVARTLTVRQPIVRTNVRGEPIGPLFLRITIERQFAAGTQSDTHLIGVVGGSISLPKPGEAQQTTSHSVRWEDSRLVFENSSSAGARTEVWQLDADTLTITVAERTPQTDSKTTARYRREGK
jgi:hypothetical protein